MVEVRRLWARSWLRALLAPTGRTRLFSCWAWLPLGSPSWPACRICRRKTLPQLPDAEACRAWLRKLVAKPAILSRHAR